MLPHTLLAFTKLVHFLYFFADRTHHQGGTNFSTLLAFRDEETPESIYLNLHDETRVNIWPRMIGKASSRAILQLELWLPWDDMLNMTTSGEAVLCWGTGESRVVGNCGLKRKGSRDHKRLHPKGGLSLPQALEILLRQIDWVSHQ